MNDADRDWYLRHCANGGVIVVQATKLDGTKVAVFNNIEKARDWVDALHREDADYDTLMAPVALNEPEWGSTKLLN